MRHIMDALITRNRKMTDSQNTTALASDLTISTDDALSIMLSHLVDDARLGPDLSIAELEMVKAVYKDIMVVERGRTLNGDMLQETFTMLVHGRTHMAWNSVTNDVFVFDTSLAPAMVHRIAVQRLTDAETKMVQMRAAMSQEIMDGTMKPLLSPKPEVTISLGSKDAWRAHEARPSLLGEGFEVKVFQSIKGDDGLGKVFLTFPTLALTHDFLEAYGQWQDGRVTEEHSVLSRYALRHMSPSI